MSTILTTVLHMFYNNIIINIHVFMYVHEYYSMISILLYFNFNAPNIKIIIY